MSFATAADLEAWGVTEEEALERAVRNLAGQEVEIQLGDGVAFVLGPDGYASSWLAVPVLLRQVAAELGGTVVAAAASRDSLVLVDVDRLGTSTDVLRQTLAEYEEATRQLSPVPYVFDGDELREWTPPAGHPVDYLILGDNDVEGDMLAVRWDDAVRIAGDALERTGYDPPRWRHRGWPDEQTMATLRAAATDLPIPR
jgi:hypothetical protein